jgi:hypothetical protein
MYPGIWEMLTCCSYPDMSARETSTLMIFSEDCKITIVLNDRANNLAAFVTGRGVSEALQRLEVKLQTDQVEWRQKKPPASRGTRPRGS